MSPSVPALATVPQETSTPDHGEFETLVGWLSARRAGREHAAIRQVPPSATPEASAPRVNSSGPQPFCDTPSPAVPMAPYDTLHP